MPPNMGLLPVTCRKTAILLYIFKWTEVYYSSCDVIKKRKAYLLDILIRHVVNRG